MACFVQSPSRDQAIPAWLDFVMQWQFLVARALEAASHGVVDPGAGGAHFEAPLRGPGSVHLFGRR